MSGGKVIDTIIGKIEEKGKARDLFEKAKEKDKAAALAHLDEAAEDSFIMELGRIKPGCIVKGG